MIVESAPAEQMIAERPITPIARRPVRPALRQPLAKGRDPGAYGKPTAVGMQLPTGQVRLKS